MGLSCHGERDKGEKGLIALLDMLSHRLDERNRQIEPLCMAAGALPPPPTTAAAA